MVYSFLEERKRETETERERGGEGRMWYLFAVVRFGYPRFGDDLAGVNVAGGEVRQLVDAGESSLRINRQKQT